MAIDRRDGRNPWASHTLLDVAVSRYSVTDLGFSIYPCCTFNLLWENVLTHTRGSTQWPSSVDRYMAVCKKCHSVYLQLTTYCAIPTHANAIVFSCKIKPKH